jgi:hypothetical protein
MNMKTIKLVGLVIIILSFTNALFAQDGDQLSIPLSNPGKPYKLTVDIVTGSIKIIAYDGKDIVVEAQTSESEVREESYIKNGMKRIPGNNSDIVAREKNNSVTIGAAIAYRNTILTIKIPKGATNIKLSTVNRGYINADGIDGDIEANNTNGAIKLYNVSGSVVANTVNGSLLVTFKNVDSKAAMAFSTLNGAINVTFPADFKANIKARSDFGKVYSDFDIVGDKLPVTTNKSKNGMLQIAANDWLYGKIGGGGPQILFKNLHGSIYLHKAK